MKHQILVDVICWGNRITNSKLFEEPTAYLCIQREVGLSRLLQQIISGKIYFLADEFHSAFL